jgi:hypothetical protein
MFNSTVVHIHELRVINSQLLLLLHQSIELLRGSLQLFRLIQLVFVKHLYLSCFSCYLKWSIQKGIQI